MRQSPLRGLCDLERSGRGGGFLNVDPYRIEDLMRPSLRVELPKLLLLQTARERPRRSPWLARLQPKLRLPADIQGVALQNRIVESLLQI